jgi:hypothetical protein
VRTKLSTHLIVHPWTCFVFVHDGQASFDTACWWWLSLRLTWRLSLHLTWRLSLRLTEACQWHGVVSLTELVLDNFRCVYHDDFRCVYCDDFCSFNKLRSRGYSRTTVDRLRFLLWSNRRNFKSNADRLTSTLLKESYNLYNNQRDTRCFDWEATNLRQLTLTSCRCGRHLKKSESLSSLRAITLLQTLRTLCKTKTSLASLYQPPNNSLNWK